MRRAIRAFEEWSAALARDAARAPVWVGVLLVLLASVDTATWVPLPVALAGLGGAILRRRTSRWTAVAVAGATWLVATPLADWSWRGGLDLGILTRWSDSLPVIVVPLVAMAVALGVRAVTWVVVAVGMVAHVVPDVTSGYPRAEVTTAAFGECAVFGICATVASGAVPARLRIHALLAAAATIGVLAGALATYHVSSGGSGIEFATYAVPLLVSSALGAHLALAAAGVPTAEPSSHGDSLVRWARSPWIASLVAGAVLSPWGTIEQHAFPWFAAFLAPLAVGTALGGDRPGAGLGRFAPAVVLPLVLGIRWIDGDEAEAWTFAAPVLVVAVPLAAALVPLPRGAERLHPVWGLGWHVIVAIGALAVVRGGPIGWMLLGWAPCAVLWTPREPRYAIPGCAAIWALVFGLIDPGPPPLPDDLHLDLMLVAEPQALVLGAAFGALCCAAVRMRSFSALPPDHPVFTEAPFVLRGPAPAYDGSAPPRR